MANNMLNSKNQLPIANGGWFSVDIGTGATIDLADIKDQNVLINYGIGTQTAGNIHLTTLDFDSTRGVQGEQKTLLFKRSDIFDINNPIISKVQLSLNSVIGQAFVLPIFEEGDSVNLICVDVGKWKIVSYLKTNPFSTTTSIPYSIKGNAQQNIAETADIPNSIVHDLIIYQGTLTDFQLTQGQDNAIELGNGDAINTGGCTPTATLDQRFASSNPSDPWFISSLGTYGNSGIRRRLIVSAWRGGGITFADAILTVPNGESHTFYDGDVLDLEFSGWYDGSMNATWRVVNIQRNGFNGAGQSVLLDSSGKVPASCLPNQIAAIADATDSSDVVTKFNQLLAGMRANGLLGS